MVNQYGKRYIALVMACMLMMPVIALAQEEDDRIAALEARIQALEEQLEALVSAGTTQAEAEPQAQPFALEETLTLEAGKKLTLVGYETGTRFRYSPAGGLSSLSLSAKKGYRLLCLYVTVENESGGDLSTASLLDAVLTYGQEFANKAQDSFYYKMNHGGYAGGLKAIGPKTAVDGCLLFAVPEDVDTSSQRLAIQIQYNGQLYECELREAGLALVPPAGESTSF